MYMLMSLPLYGNSRICAPSSSLTTGHKDTKVNTDDIAYCDYIVKLPGKLNTVSNYKFSNDIF